MLNVRAERYIEGDIDPFVVGLHRLLLSQSEDNGQRFMEELFSKIEHYGLSCSFRRDDVPEELKRAFRKTYFARFNKEAYQRLRADFNCGGRSDFSLLYLLIIYGFNHMIRFNANGEFNLPVGNVDFNRNVFQALLGYFETVREREIDWHTTDFREFLDRIEPGKNDFLYLDPPYLITFSEYNKLWSEKEEQDLTKALDLLDSKGGIFGISNVTHYKGRINRHFLEWSSKYTTHEIISNYISYHDNTQKRPREVFVTNY